MVMGFQTQPGQPLYTLAGLASRSFVTEKFQRLVWVGISGVIVELGQGGEEPTSEWHIGCCFTARSLFHRQPGGRAIWQHSNSRLTCFSVCRSNTSRCPASA